MKDYDPYLFDDPPSDISAALVVLHTGELSREGNPSFVFVEQKDRPNRPFGFAGGHVQEGEIDPKQTATREISEETGLQIDPQRLRLMTVSRPRTDRTGYVFYSLQTDIATLEQLGRWELVDIQPWVGGYWQLVGELCHNSNEVGTAIRVPRVRLFERGHPVLSHILWGEPMTDFKWWLEGKRII